MTDRLSASPATPRHKPPRRRLHLAVISALLGLPPLVLLPDALPSAHAAETIAPRNYDIPAGPLASTLLTFAQQAGIQLSVDAGLTAGLNSKGLRGQHSLASALAALLGGTGLEAVNRGGNEYTLRKLPVQQGDTTLAPVTVTAGTEQENAWGPVKGYVAKRSATGTKTDTPIIETPQSISVVSSDFIGDSGALRLKEALAYTPGINTSPWGADSRFDWTVIRGFDAQTPGYYLDGLQLRNNNGWAIWQTENYGSERIEVLRGPASVLYGQNSAGGMINVVSKRPSQEPLHELQVQLGNDAHRQLAADFSGPIDEDGKVLYRLTGLVRDAELPGTGLPGDRTYFAPALTWRPSDKTSLTLLAHYLRIRDGGSYRAFPEQGSLLSNPNGKIPAKNYLGEPDFDRFDQDQTMIGYLFEHRFDDTWTFRQNARYGKIKVDYQAINIAGFVTVNALDPSDPANFRTASRWPFSSREKTELLGIDNQLQAAFALGDWRHTLLLGLDHQYSDQEQRTASGGTVGDIDAYSPTYGSAVTTAAPWFDGTTKLSQTGFYLQDQIKWGRWAATIGGRYDKAKAVLDSNLDGSRTQVRDGKFTGRAGLVYLHPSGLAPYFSYAESFSPTATIDPLTGNPLKPETGKQYEAGVRYQPEGANYRISTAVFDLRRQNYITYDSSWNPKQTGEIVVRGFELEAAIQPVQRLNTVLAYTHIPKAEVTASSTPSEIGKQMNAVARNQISLWNDYRFVGGFKVGLGIRCVGSTHGYQESASAKVPSYTLFDGMLGYQFGPWTLALNARNLADKAYLSNCSSGSCYYGERRKVLGTLSYRW